MLCLIWHCCAAAWRAQAGYVRSFAHLTGSPRGRPLRARRRQVHHQESIMLKGKSAVVTGSTSGIGLAIARALAKEGANVMINGFGDKAAIENERAGIEKDFGVKSIYSAADMTKPAEIAAMIKTAEKTFGSRRHPGQQCRHPVRRADRGIPDRQVGRDHRHQSVGGVPRHPRRGARHEGAQMGPHHQHRLGAFAGRLAVQVRLRHRQARPRRPDQDGGARSSRPSASPSTASAPAMSGRRWSRSRFPTP